MPENQKSTGSEQSDDGSAFGPSRRKFMVAGAGAWASAAMAGCSGDGEDTPTETGTATSTPESTATPEEQPENFVVTQDMISGSEYIPSGTGGFVSSCKPQRQFVPGMQAVFKVGIWDPSSGEQLGSDTLDTVEVSFPDHDIDAIELAWGGDDEEEPAQEWSNHIIVPEMDPQTVSFDVSVSNGDANYYDVGVHSSEFEVIDYTEPAVNYIVTEDTYATSDINEKDAAYSQGCLEQDVFSPDLAIGFDIGIWDADTGDLVFGTDDVVDSAQLALGNGDTVDLVPPEDGLDEGETAEDWEVGDHGWNAVYRGLSADFLDGQDSATLEFEVQVTGSNESTTFEKVGIYQSSVTIIPDPSSSS